jgi:photosystem II stability/assembly factor-like uncharacterized protein
MRLGLIKFLVLVNLFGTVSGIYAQAVWQALGPVFNPGLGIGRLECIGFNPFYNGKTIKTMYVGSPTGGLWKSKDGGLSWSNADCSTDQLPFIGVADIAVNPRDTNELFIANGSKYPRKYISALGVYRSADGGKTWVTVSRGMELDPHALNCIARILIDPVNVKTLYAATSQGIYKTTNSGKKWKKLLEGDYHGLEFNSANSNILYAAGTRSTYNEDMVILRSLNGGKSWQEIAQDGGAFKGKENLSIDIAVSPSSPAILYVLSANKEGLRTNELFVSTDAGKTWKAKTIPYPNDNRDKVAIGVSPSDPGEIYIGKAWDFYKSINICDSAFNKRPQKSQWAHLNISHADIHSIKIAPGSNEVFVAHDGGLYNATTNKDASNGLNIATINSVSSSETKNGFAITGHQDCGANIYDASLAAEKQWKNVLGGDGRESIIDYSTEKNILSTSINLGTTTSYGPNQRSMDGGLSFGPLSRPADPGLNALNNGPVTEDPVLPNVYYFGFTQLYKATFTNPSGNEINWEQLTHLSDMVPYSVLTAISVNPLQPNFIYAGFVAGRVFKTTTGGEGMACTSGCWKEISPFKNLIYYNLVKTVSAPEEPERVWAAFTGGAMAIAQADDTLTSGIHKIMYSPNGGQSWEAFAQGLPETPVYSFVYVRGTKDLLFAGTEAGIYFRDADMQGWQAFNNGFPNVTVSEIYVNYHEKALYAATYGRGLWKIDISDQLK